MSEETKIMFFTLCFPVKGRSVLLARKVKKICKGNWNGYGGGIESGEKPTMAAPRELWEESDLIAESGDMVKVAIVDFHNEPIDGEKFIYQVHVFLLYKWTGEPKTTDEMADPTWFDVDDIPFKEMMPADEEWLPPVLKGKKIMAKARQDPYTKTLLSKVEITEVDSFPEE